jgi:hypothetical protein
MGNPFDAVAIKQRKMRDEAENYRFFIYRGFVTNVDECVKLYSWYDADGEITDKNGATRICLLQKIPDYRLCHIVNAGKMKYQPSQLKSYIEERLGIEKS